MLVINAFCAFSFVAALQTMIQSSTQGALCILYIVTCLTRCASINCALCAMITTSIAFSIFWIIAFLASNAFAIRITESAMFNVKASLAFHFSHEKTVFTGQTAIFCCAFYAVLRTSNASSFFYFISFITSCALSLWVAKKTMRSGGATSCTLSVLHEIRIFTFCATVCLSTFLAML